MSNHLELPKERMKFSLPLVKILKGRESCGALEVGGAANKTFLRQEHICSVWRISRSMKAVQKVQLAIKSCWAKKAKKMIIKCFSPKRMAKWLNGWLIVLTALAKDPCLFSSIFSWCSSTIFDFKFRDIRLLLTIRLYHIWGTHVYTQTQICKKARGFCWIPVSDWREYVVGFGTLTTKWNEWEWDREMSHILLRLETEVGWDT